MHQGAEGWGDEAVDDEEVFFDAESGVEAFEVAGAVGFDAMAEDEVLGAGGSSDGIGLDEGEAIEGALEGGGFEEAAGDGVAAEIVEGGHLSSVSCHWSFVICPLSVVPGHLPVDRARGREWRSGGRRLRTLAYTVAESSGAGDAEDCLNGGRMVRPRVSRRLRSAS